MTSTVPPYQGPADATGTLTCPKCGGRMRTVDRNGVHIEQCQTCRGVFLDFGELEHLTELEGRFLQQPQPGYPHSNLGTGPQWGVRQGQPRRGGLAALFFSS